MKKLLLVLLMVVCSFEAARFIAEAGTRQCDVQGISAVVSEAKVEMVDFTPQKGTSVTLVLALRNMEPLRVTGWSRKPRGAARMAFLAAKTNAEELLAAVLEKMRGCGEI